MVDIAFLPGARYAGAERVKRYSMSEEMMAVIGFGAIGAIAVVMLVRERLGVARRKAARGGREVDLSGIFADPPKTGQGGER